MKFNLIIFHKNEQDIIIKELIYDYNQFFCMCSLERIYLIAFTQDLKQLFQPFKTNRTHRGTMSSP
jgi:hypothetical protein